MEIVKRQKLVDYNVYVARDGKEFETKSACEDYEKILDGTRMVCPDCDGKGGHYGRWVEAYDNYDIGHSYVDGHYEWNRCQRCGGKGYLEKTVTWK